MLKIIAVEHRINSSHVLNTTFDSKETLLEADIVVIDPDSPTQFWRNLHITDDGSRLLFSKNGSDKVRQIFAWRSQELETLLEDGKVIFVFMAPLDSVDGQISGRSKYEPITNYDWLPSYGIPELFPYLISPGSGSTIILKNSSHPISPYYKAFKGKLSYCAYLKIMKYKDQDQDTFFMVNKTGNPVGCSFKVRKGLLVFIPYPPKNVDSNKLVDVLIQCAEPYLTRDFKTPEPEWSKDYNIPGEEEILKIIEKIQKKIEEKKDERNKLESKRESLSTFRYLIYEKGKPLEEVVLKAFQLMEFRAERFEKEDMEHDIILESPEGRILVEIEGKDNDAIHVDKLDQLTRVIDEDFSIHEVYSEGLLVGNPYRFTHPDKRKNAFTKKVKTAAKRKKFGLLTTVELFRSVVKILEYPNDDNLKRNCREVIFRDMGKQIIFIKD